MLGTLKKLVERLAQVRTLRLAHYICTRVILEIFAFNRAAAIIYSIFTFPTFNREQFSVLRGRRDYYRELSSKSIRSPELRRSIHRIEKGLSMRPMRKRFAESYIIETVSQYRRISQNIESNKKADMEEIRWVHDVLQRYFSLAERTQITKNAFDTFSGVTYNQPGEKDHAPYPAGNRTQCRISFEEFQQLTQRRRSVRWFLDKPIPRDLIDKALSCARMSPTACNRQPYEFLIYDDSNMVKKVASVPFGTQGYSEQIPTIAVVVGNLNNYASPRDRHAIYIDSSLAVMSFLFALETLGLSSTIINWPDFEPLELQMQRLLGLKTSQRITMLVAVGYADPKGMVPYSGKKGLDHFRSYNRLRGS